MKIICVGPNTVVPIHSEESSELLQILEGEGCQIGFAGKSNFCHYLVTLHIIFCVFFLVGDWIDQQTINYFPATQTKVLKVSKHALEHHLDAANDLQIELMK